MNTVAVLLLFAMPLLTQSASKKTESFWSKVLRIAGVSATPSSLRRGEVNQRGHLGYGSGVRFCAATPYARWWVYVTGFRSPRAEYFGPQKRRFIPGFAQGPNTRESPVTYRRHQIGWDQPR